MTIKSATPTAPELLEAAAATYRERNAVYGDNYKYFGIAMCGLFPQGVTLRTADDFNRMGVLVQCLSKLSRYAQNLERGGHIDSALDLTTYAAMLNELTARDDPWAWPDPNFVPTKEQP